MPDTYTAPRVPPAETSLAAAYRRIARENVDGLGILEDSPSEASSLIFNRAYHLSQVLSVAFDGVADSASQQSQYPPALLSGGVDALAFLLGLGMIAQRAADEEAKAR